MKRLLALLLVFLAVLSLIPAAAAEDIEIIEVGEEPPVVDEPADEASGGVAINSTNFPDEVFRTYVSDFFDWDEDGRLDSDELKEATEIDVSRQGVASLKGVEWLTYLTELECSWNDLAALDLSKNTALTSLSCSHNELTALDVSCCPALTELICSYNQLTALDVTHNPSLVVLVCGYNELTALDLSRCPELKGLDCWSNRLSKLNVSKNPQLISLDCSWNRLTKLNLAKNPELMEFWCYENKLSALDLSHNPSLVTFWCYNNSLTELDLSHNPALAELNCGGNQLTGLDVRSNPKLQSLWVWGNLLSTIDLSYNNALVEFYCESNQLTALDLSFNPSLKALRCLFNPLDTVYVHPDAQLVSAETDEGVQIVRIAPKKPAITAQPESRSAKAGETVTYAVEANGGGLKYQWYFRTSASDTWKRSSADGAASAVLTVEAKTSRDGYQYRCRISNLAGSRYSSAASLTVLTEPAVTTQPESVVAAAGSTVTFTVAAAGGELNYQWQFKRNGGAGWSNSSMKGAKTPTLTVEATAARNGYRYRCKVTNAAGTAVSNAATLTVEIRPVITAQPKSVSAAAGTAVSFSVAAAGEELSYQWQFRSSSSGAWKNSGMRGAKTPTLTVEATAARDGYQYRCKVTNPDGTAVSGTATLTVK